MGPFFKFFASDDTKVAHLLAAVDAAASRCTAAAQQLEAAAIKEASLKGKGEEVEADAARATKLTAELLAAAADDVAVAKKTLAIVSHAIAKAAVPDASAATRVLVELLGKDNSTHADVVAATEAASNAMLAIADKQALASAARTDAAAAVSFAKAATSFASSPTSFYTFSWEGVQPSTTINQEKRPTPSMEKGEGSNNMRGLMTAWGRAGPRGQIIATAARLINREMASMGRSFQSRGLQKS